MAYSENLLEGKSAIVTGGRRGIGRGIALELAKAGADVVVCDNVTEDGKLDEVAGEVKNLKRASLALKVDVAQKASVDNMVQSAIDKFGKIDILVNCAGVCLPGESVLECGEKNWDIAVNVNLKGTFLCSQAAARKMAERKQGNIINIASEAGIWPIANVGAYSASKAGVITFTQQIAMELAEYNIRVNTISPGMMPTDINAPLWDTPEKAKAIADSIVIGRLGEMSDIGHAVVFLASDKSGFITGHNMVVNGGGTMPAPRV